MKLTHLDDKGAAHMVEVGHKAVTQRRAKAEGFVRLNPATLELLVQGGLPKGDALAVARIAGIMGAKKTPDLIPLCHPLPLSAVSVELFPEADGVRVVAEAATAAQTGVEMEALTAVSLAALALYDMVKAVQKDAVIQDIRLLEKSGGKSGDYRRKDEPLPPR